VACQAGRDQENCQRKQGLHQFSNKIHRRGDKKTVSENWHRAQPHPAITPTPSVKFFGCRHRAYVQWVETSINFSVRRLTKGYHVIILLNTREYM
jgi:hypothetical protein